MKSHIHPELQIKTAAYQESAKGILETKIQQSAKHHKAIEVLMKVVPWESLSADDEKSLRELLCWV